MRAAVDNQTAFVNGEVEAVVWWTLGRLMVNVPELAVRVIPTLKPHHGGRFYANAWSDFPRVFRRGIVLPPAVRHLIVADVPYVPIGRWVSPLKTQTPPPVECRTWRESLVAIVAHEGTHYQQWADAEVLSEHEAEWAEVHTLAMWRERRKP